VTGENGPTAREFDMLREDVARVTTRLNSIDDHGTRGVVGLTVQITELIREFNEFKLQVMTRFTSHDNLHDKEERERAELAIKAAEDARLERIQRRNSRRWIAGFSASAVLALCAVITLLVYILVTIRGH